MKNKCKHKNAKPLVPISPVLAYEWWWCPDCGAIRMDVRVIEAIGEAVPEPEAEIQHGKWKSPKMVTYPKKLWEVLTGDTYSGGIDGKEN